MDAVGEAYRELLDAAAGLDADWAAKVPDGQARLEGYHWAMSLLSIAQDVFVSADAARPRFVDIVGPYRKFYGDNPDAFYQFAPLDPARGYRVTGRRGDAVYLSLTVYGTALDSTGDRIVDTDRIVGLVNDRDLAFDADGRFEIVLAPARPAGYTGAFVELVPETVCAITRDYLTDAVEGRRVEWRIEPLGADAGFAAAPTGHRLDAEDQAERFRAAARWVRRHGQMFPSTAHTPNTVAEPYPVPTVTRGWAAGDACYASGAFALDKGQALVVRGRSPECVFWNVCLWNGFLTTFNYEYRDTEPVSLNGAQVRYEPDGSWTVVIAHENPGRPEWPNWISTAGHGSGILWFRWFLAEALPERPTVELVELAELADPAGV
ncbi:DUF1214 domain-containing protein [Yinghuangia soli]|uniref:DUF1214 domain-containing protein n=1 Tax=Yinghuangia soli TaxID=2908204 RepID=A0AA41U387_9ACTN|nr:DUF1214 domain-containing protein [Yinghuangia soli]MCF2531570.1 DUF1214 domain-containing protein [Yinghuangia soli]